ncbi:MAG: amidohydrolase family protein [Gemmatimonadaceae bacterium]
MRTLHRNTLAVLCAIAALAQSGIAQRIAIRNVTVIDVAAGRHLRNQAVVIEGDSISAVVPERSLNVSGVTRTVDGSGKYLIPGMWDMHIHLISGGRPSLALLVANGVVGVRDMGGALEQVRAWRDSIASGTLLGPRIEMVGPIIENKQWLDRVVQMMTQQGNQEVSRALAERIAVATPEDARAAVEGVAVLGVTMLKVRNDPPAPAFFTLLREAKQRGIRVVGHPPLRGPSLGDASDSGMASIEHLIPSFREGSWASALDVMTPEARAALAEKWARNRTAFDPTIIAGIGFRSMPDSLVLAIIDDTSGTRDRRMRYVSRALAREWRSQIEMKKVEGPQPDWATLNRQAAANVRMLDSAGVIILTGSDLGGPLVYPGFAIHDELGLLVREGGMSPARALRAATLGAAQFFKEENRMGTVARGMRADLVLLSADPLADIANIGRIDSVILRGRLLDRAALDRILSDIAAQR